MRSGPRVRGGAHCSLTNDGRGNIASTAATLIRAPVRM
jgi:hypothetical protein